MKNLYVRIVDLRFPVLILGHRVKERALWRIPETFSHLGGMNSLVSGQPSSVEDSWLLCFCLFHMQKFKVR